MNAGWVKIYRSLLDSPIWLAEPFSRGQSWVDLLLLANHRDQNLWFEGSLIEIKRGQHMTSYRKLGARWQWSVGKVKRFIEQLVFDKMVTARHFKNGTLLTLINYSDYQDEWNTERTRIDTPVDTPTEPNKKDKELKKVRNNIYAQKVREVVDYLNDKTGSRYKPTTPATVKHITARLNEGFGVDSLKKVIDIKTAEWLGSDMSKFLRPETLFGSKFESYLNQHTGKEVNHGHNEQRAEYNALDGIFTQG